jgi:signal transduction histidine kinase
MKTLLVLAAHPGFADAIQAGINPEHYRVIARGNLEEGEPLLEHGLAQACIVDVELTGAREIWFLEKLRQKAPRCPIILYSSASKPEWEEEAYLRGVAHVLIKPVRGRLLSALLDRLWSTPAATNLPQPGPPPRSREPEKLPDTAVAQAPTQTLGVLRGFSGILTHSLNAEGMLRQFLLLLREILSINRAAIFLRQPSTAFGTAPTLEEGRRLRAACAIGLSPGLLQNLELSFEAGIGGHLFRHGRILRRSAEEARADVETQKEFDLLGAQVAVPILDRETVLGVAVFDGRITGEPLVNSELELIFHLLEQLGMAIKNIWLHDQLAGNHEMMTGILRELSSACVVVSRDLAILHANKTARKYFSRRERRGGDMEFTDLPQLLGSKVYQVLKTGAATPSFRYEPEESPGTVYNINIVPFQRHQAGLPASALLMAEDLTQSEQLRRLEVEAANLRLVKRIADRLPHEINNAMMPISVHQQLLGDKWKDAEFRASLNSALAVGVTRVTRLANQMLFLARDEVVSHKTFPVAPLIEEAFEEACKHQSSKAAQLNSKAAQLKSDASAKVLVAGDRPALKHALAEVMLNALQANEVDPKIVVRVNAEPSSNGLQGLQIEVQDTGTGFTPEVARQAPAPFFTTRIVGVGLGLTVSRKIIETHRGKLEIVTASSGQPGVVRISLPAENPVSGQT